MGETTTAHYDHTQLAPGRGPGRGRRDLGGLLLCADIRAVPPWRPHIDAHWAVPYTRMESISLSRTNLPTPKTGQIFFSNATWSRQTPRESASLRLGEKESREYSISTDDTAIRKYCTAHPFHGTRRRPVERALVAKSRVTSHARTDSHRETCRRWVSGISR